MFATLCAAKRRANENALRREPKDVRLGIRKDLVGLVGSLAGDIRDIAAADAEVAKFTVRHAAEFVDGLAILDPVVVSACEVHFRFLSCWLRSG